MEKRFVQAHREARWSFWLAIAYVAAWSLTAAFGDNQPGITGLPHWFEMACLLVPLLFIFFCWLMIKRIFRDISLEDTP